MSEFIIAVCFTHIVRHKMIVAEIRNVRSLTNSHWFTLTFVKRFLMISGASCFIAGMSGGRHLETASCT